MVNISRFAGECCPACASVGLRLLSSPRPEYVVQCIQCESTFFEFGIGNTVSHNNQYSGEEGYQRYLEATNESSLQERHEEAIDHLMTLIGSVEKLRLFDVGAGGGDFLARARARGFDIAGNEVSKPAIDVCRDRHGIDLMLGDDLEGMASSAGGYDVVTMWCVIAHVDDPRRLLKGARALLRPGGVLFFSTPRYCIIDRVALILRQLSGDRYRRMFDRRINSAHRRQYSGRGLECLLRDEGFVPVGVSPAIGYGLRMVAYLRSIGMPNKIAIPVGRVLELSARLGLAPRNILNVYAVAS